MTSKTYFTLTDLSHDTDLAQALGGMVVVWAHAETVLMAMMALITGMPLNMAQDGYYRIPTFEARTKFILALLPEWAPSSVDKDVIRVAIEKLSKLAATRNHWIHGDWCVADDKSETVIFDNRLRPDSPGRRKPVKAIDVRQHCVAVSKRAEELEDLIDIDKLL